MEKRGQKELLTTLECLNYKKSLPSCFIASRDSPFSKMFSPLFCFAQEKALKNFSKKLYTIKIKKKEEEETKSSAKLCMPKIPQILEQSGDTRQVCVSVFFLF